MNKIFKIFGIVALVSVALSAGAYGVIYGGAFMKNKFGIHNAFTDFADRCAKEAALDLRDVYENLENL